MKRRHGLARSVPRLDPSALEALPTRALLARLDRLRRCEQSPADSDLTPEEIASVGDAILFKDSDAWRDATAALKATLATREHVTRPPERPRKKGDR